jgi:hypothetical protein
MKPIVLASLAGVGILVILSPEGQRFLNGLLGSATRAATKPAKPATSTTPARPRDALPQGLEMYRKPIEWSCDANKVRVSLLGALIERENRTFNPAAKRTEMHLTLAPWFIACLAPNSGAWTPIDFASSYGFVQILAATAVCDLKVKDLSPETITLPKTNIELGARYLAKCIKLQKGDVLMGLVRYNGGGGAVQAVQAGNVQHPSFEYANDVIQRERRIIADAAKAGGAA